MNKQKLLIIFGIYLLITIPFYVFDLGGSNHDLITNILYLIPPLVATVLGFLAARAYGFSTPKGKALLLLAFGFFFWFIGEVLYFVLDLILEQSPFPSLADVYYIIGYPLLFIGLVMKAKVSPIKWTKQKTIIMLIYSLILDPIVLYFGVFKVYDSSVGIVQNFTSIFYGVGDLILLATSLAVLLKIIEYKQGKLFLPWLLILIGFFLTLIADILFTQFFTEYNEDNLFFRNMDLLWILSYLAIGFGFFGLIDVIRTVQKNISKK
jgi:hypothetical protein